MWNWKYVCAEKTAPVKSEDPEDQAPDPTLLTSEIESLGDQLNPLIEASVPKVDAKQQAAFRLVQEALTNTLKHAGPQARAWVRIQYADGQLEIEVEDDGRGLVAGLGRPGGNGNGHGLMGMRERVALYGGDLRIGPRSGGGFEVRARFPLEVQ